uniref:Uncharacterized protein n=1 Tax=Timema monikensis TaxID=170555 RepID=A0A7R9HHP1_9NEOP|nr:unnamed protein product [Timema monikensis]
MIVTLGTSGKMERYLDHELETTLVKCATLFLGVQLQSRAECPVMAPSQVGEWLKQIGEGDLSTLNVKKILSTSSGQSRLAITFLAQLSHRINKLATNSVCDIETDPRNVADLSLACCEYTTLLDLSARKLLVQSLYHIIKYLLDQGMIQEAECLRGYVVTTLPSYCNEDSACTNAYLCISNLFKDVAMSLEVSYAKDSTRTRRMDCLDAALRSLELLACGSRPALNHILSRLVAHSDWLEDLAKFHCDGFKAAARPVYGEDPPDDHALSRKICQITSKLLGTYLAKGEFALSMNIIEAVGSCAYTILGPDSVPGRSLVLFHRVIRVLLATVDGDPNDLSSKLRVINDEFEDLVDSCNGDVNITLCTCLYRVLQDLSAHWMKFTDDEWNCRLSVAVQPQLYRLMLQIVEVLHQKDVGMLQSTLLASLVFYCVQKCAVHKTPGYQTLVPQGCVVLKECSDLLAGLKEEQELLWVGYWQKLAVNAYNLAYICYSDGLFQESKTILSVLWRASLKLEDKLDQSPLCFKVWNTSKSVTDNEVCSLLDLGTCGLHVVHGFLRTGVESVYWDVSSLLRHMYYLFTDSPVHSALFTQLTGCASFPLKFCGVRWLENAKCFQRALQIWDHVVKFLKEAKLPKTKPVETLKRAACDPFLKCKLAFCKTIADECQPFLQQFQTSKPMTPYLFEAVEKLLRYLMNRCVKPDLMKCTGPKLLSIDTKKSENLILSKNIDIGFATKRLLGETAITVTERQKLEFIHECRSMLTTMIAKLQEKSPLKQKAVRGLSSLDPCVIQHSPQLAQKRFSFLLEELNHANIINDVLAENAKKEYLHFCNLKKSELQEIFRPCDQFSDEVGLDTIYGSFLIGEANYKHLWEVIKICLVLSHGNATVEGGFSVNKSLLVENMHEKTVIAQRHIHDEIQEAGGIKNIHISKKMLDYVRGARKRYHEYLEMKKQERSEEGKKKAEKRKLDIQVNDLEGKRKKLMMATEEKLEAIEVELQELKKK